MSLYLSVQSKIQNLSFCILIYAQKKIESVFFFLFVYYRNYYLLELTCALNVKVFNSFDFFLGKISSYNFLHEADELHQATAQLGHLLFHLQHMLVVDLHQRLEGVATML